MSALERKAGIPSPTEILLSPVNACLSALKKSKNLCKLMAYVALRLTPEAPTAAHTPLVGTDKLTHTRGLELQNSCGDTIITDRWLHLERNLMQKKAGYSHF